MMKKVVITTTVLVFAIILFHPGRHAKYYNFIPVFDVINELVSIKNQNVKPNLKECSYEFYSQLILSEAEINGDEVYNINNFTTPLNGGEYSPKDCHPIFKSAIIVPYRNRQEHLKIFLNYMHSFLQAQKIHYKIIIVEQNDNYPFNRAKMLNVGANEAINSNFPCLILHDVDLFPLNNGNIYACTKKPRHMSSSVDTFRFNLPYLGLFGGAISIQSMDFKHINGMSNVFDGWGGEDDDFFKRLEAYDLIPYRFAPEISRYSMLFHKKERASNDRWKKLKYSLKRQKEDGLNSIPNNYKVVLEPLYTHPIIFSLGWHQGIKSFKSKYTNVKPSMQPETTNSNRGNAKCILKFIFSFLLVIIILLLVSTALILARPKESFRKT